MNCMLSKLFLETKQLFVALATGPAYNRAYTTNSFNYVPLDQRTE